MPDVLERGLDVVELVRFHDRDDELHDRSKSTVRVDPLPDDLGVGRDVTGRRVVQDEVGVREHAELRHVETLDLGFFGDTRICMKCLAIVKMNHVMPHAQTKPTTTWTICAHELADVAVEQALDVAGTRRSIRRRRCRRRTARPRAHPTRRSRRAPRSHRTDRRRARRSKNATLYTTSTPATPPMMTAAHGATNAHPAVIATSPASMPLHDIEMSGLPYFTLVMIIAMTKPTHAASNVLTATRPMRRSVAPSVEPGLKPIQPNTRMSVPITT